MIPGRYPSPSPVKERVWMALFTSTGSGNYCTEFTGGGEEGVCLGTPENAQTSIKGLHFFATNGRPVMRDTKESVMTQVQLSVLVSYM